MKDSATWVGVLVAVVLPFVAALVILYSDVQTLKVTKAEQREVLELKVEFTKQMSRNTVAIENLNDTLKVLGRRFDNGK